MGEELPGLVSEEIHNPSASVVLGVEEFPDTYVAPSTDTGQRIEEEFPGLVNEENSVRNPSANGILSVEDFPVPGSGESAIPNPLPNVVSGVEDLHMNIIPTSSSSAMPGLSSDIASVMDETDMDTVPPSMIYPVSEPHLNGVSNNEEIIMVDEVEHPLILSGVREKPFTYLASLSAKRAAMKGTARSVQGMIKVCIIFISFFLGRLFVMSVRKTICIT